MEGVFIKDYTTQEKIYYFLEKFCESVDLDDFTLNEQETEYPKISLEALYYPIKLSTIPFSTVGMPQLSTSKDDYAFNIGELIERIDKKIAELEALEKKHKNINSIVNEEHSFTTYPVIDKQNLLNKVQLISTSLNEEPVQSINKTSFDSKHKIEKNDTQDYSDREDLVIVQAPPGGGKTMWCKRICLAYMADDTEFLEKNFPSLNFGEEKFPLLLLCRNLQQVYPEYRAYNDSNLGGSFTYLSYLLMESVFGKEFSDTISKEDFDEIVRNKVKDGKLVIIVDGWDEILDSNIEDNFSKLLGEFLKYMHKDKDVSIIITVRNHYNHNIPLLRSKRNFELKQLSTKDVREFCRQWYEVTYRGNPQRIENYKNVIAQLESPAYSQITYMTRSPYLLRNLLRLSQYRGRLPISIKELYENTIEMMVEWFTKLDSKLYKEDIKIQLEYIANYMTKNSKILISEDELSHTLENCFIDLDGYFACPPSNENFSKYVSEFTSRNCVLEHKAGKWYGFPHRQMQDYLSACAILHRTSDAEYNDLNPLDILRKHYNERSWHQIIVFSALVGNGWFVKLLVDDLLNYARTNLENYLYTNLLFLIVSNGVDLFEIDKRKIYDICFEKSITDVQIDSICRLVDSNNTIFSSFKLYVEQKFMDSLYTDTLNFEMVWAIIRAKELTLAGRNPLQEAELLIFSNDRADFITGTQILNILAWCKCLSVAKKEFGIYYDNVFFRVSRRTVKTLISKLFNKNEKHNGDIAETIKYCVLAGFIGHEQFGELDISSFLSEICNPNNEISMKQSLAIEKILSVWPIYIGDQDYSGNYVVPEDTLKKYLEKYRTQLLSKDSENIVFAFNLCSAIGCWTASQIYEQFKSVQKISKSDEIAMVRVKQLEEILWTSQLSYYINIFQDNAFLEYRIIAQKNSLSVEGKARLDDMSESGKTSFIFDNEHINNKLAIIAKNNLAYLLRRGEIEKIYIGRGDDAKSLSEEELLAQGCANGDSFSLVNSALCKSGIAKNCVGNYSVGLKYLRGELNPNDSSVANIIQWWWSLAEHDELEGLIVLFWMYELGCLNFDSAPKKVVFLISRFRNSVSILGKEFKKIFLELEAQYLN